MKTLRNSVLSILVCTLFFSCQKVLQFENNLASSGSLSKDGTGNCLTITINGIYKVNTPLDNTHYIDVSVNVSLPGSYEIKTDTVNGVHFGDSAQFTTAGVQIVRLQGYGNPLSAGPFSFIVRYNTSTCVLAIPFTPAGGGSAATFTLAGAPGACTAPLIQGTYVAGTPLNASNKIIISVDVSLVGTYTLATTTVNGFSFSATGTFTTTGNQTVTLSGNGTPVTAGTNNLSVTGAVAGCSFNITVDPAPGGSGTKIKRIIQSITGTRQAYITAVTYDAANRLLTFKEWKEDSSFTPIKITGANYSSITYNGTTDYPIKNTITDETLGTDSTLYFYDGSNRVIKEDWYFGGQVSVRNTYTYLSATEIILGKYIFSAPGPALNFRGNDTMAFDAQNRITASRSGDASHVPDGGSTYTYDNKNNPFFLINFFRHAFTLYCDDGKFFYRAPNNLTLWNHTNPPSSESIIINYVTYNSNSYPVYATGSSINPPIPTENYTISFEYY